MTMLCKEELATPRERMLRVGPERSNYAPPASFQVALLAYQEALASLSAALPARGAGVGASASTQFVGAADPRRVSFGPVGIVSGSAFAGTTLALGAGTGVNVLSRGLGLSSMQPEYSFLYWAPVESENQVASLTRSAPAVQGERQAHVLGHDDDELLNWEALPTPTRPSAGRVHVRLREGARVPFRLVTDD